MKIAVDDVDLFTLSDTHSKVIMDNVSSDIFEADMMRRLQWILTHKYDECFKALKARWDPILATRMASVPTDPDAYATLVFSQPDYMDAKARLDAATPKPT
jgi:hypothetical protein